MVFPLWWSAADCYTRHPAAWLLRAGDGFKQ